MDQHRSNDTEPGERVVLPDWPTTDTDEKRRPPEGRRIEPRGTDVQPGPEFTDQPRAGATEPPD